MEKVDDAFMSPLEIQNEAVDEEIEEESGAADR